MKGAGCVARKRVSARQNLFYPIVRLGRNIHHHAIAHRSNAQAFIQKLPQPAAQSGFIKDAIRLHDVVVIGVDLTDACRHQLGILLVAEVHLLRYPLAFVGRSFFDVVQNLHIRQVDGFQPAKSGGSLSSLGFLSHGFSGYIELILVKRSAFSFIFSSLPNTQIWSFFINASIKLAALCTSARVVASTSVRSCCLSS